MRDVEEKVQYHCCEGGQDIGDGTGDGPGFGAVEVIRLKSISYASLTIIFWSTSK